MHLISLVFPDLLVSAQLLILSSSATDIYINNLAMFAQFSHLICCEPRPSFPTPYIFTFGGESLQANSQTFQGNGVKTTKYNVLNFLPKSIITQYRRLANLFFLIVASISTVPNVTPLSPGLIWAPLVFVLVISLVKELYEDYTRFKTDEQVNQLNSVSVLRAGRLQTIKWKDVVVGDICRVNDKETFPADLMLISSSDRDGLAYIETATLDGELTSKTRYAFQQLNIYNSQDELATFTGTFQAAPPSFSLAEFRGSIIIGQQRLTMTDSSQLLFRGAKLKNTEWVWGLAVYTGQCSKIMMNGQNFTTKLSSLERKLNYLLVSLLFVQTALCVVIAALSVRSQRSMMDSHSYLYWQNRNAGSSTFVMNFLMFFIEFSSSIPVSLIVTMEIAKTAQSYFIDFDQLMFSSWRKRKTFARIASLNEELGQVQYVFCDKTGTLTKNLLKFHTAVVGNTFYEFAYNNENNKYSCQRMLKALQGANRVRGDERHTLSLGNHGEVLELYLLGVLVCNNVSTVGDAKYQSQSPDEIALINMAKDMGYQLLKRDKNSLIVSMLGTVNKIEVMGKFNFTSQRKRMSTIIRWKDTFLIFTKGADNVILERSIASQFNVANSIDSLTYKGLRSLLIAFRALSASQVKSYIDDFEHAAMQEKELVKEHYSDEFQQRLTIIGATGLLDQLQDGVPETLRDLQRAGIKVWMLTGDKLQTALQVGKSCNLIEGDYEVIVMRDTVRSIKDQFQDSRRLISNSGRKCSLAIEGSILAIIFSNPQLIKEFTELTLFLQSVVCCRLLPVQKSQVVKMIKQNLQKVCLAVGDGGNDVSMIKQASIGVGLYGQQGMSAVQASDYAIPEFRMLWRLLFVHGRWNYIRISQMVLYFVYKSLIFTIPRILFQFQNAYSGYPIYDDYYIACYNVVFTALPLLIRALFQQDFNYVVKANESEESIDALVSSQSLEEKKYLPKGYTINEGLRKLFPKIYFIGQNSMCFNLKECFLWVAEAVLMGAAIFYIIKKSLGMYSINQAGLNNTFPFLSLTVFSGVVMIVTIKLCMQVKHWTKMLFFTIIVLSIAPYIAFMWFINSYFNRPVGRILYICFTTAKGYLSVLFLIVLLVGFNGLLNFARFSSHRILKRMAIALEQDDELLSYLSSQRDGMMEDALRRSDNALKQKPRHFAESQGIIV